jgi:formylglycine-generating enzyme required for sulfatase activity
MKKFVKLTVILMFGLLAGKVWSSNIQIFETPTIELAGGANTHRIVQFSLSWDYSWRTVDPNNWDAAWVFVKYRVGSGHWDHMYLDHTYNPQVGENNGDAHAWEYGYSFVPGLGSTGERAAVGVFLYRAESGRGSIKWDDVRLRWHFDRPGIYHGGNVTATDEITVRVFAIEMVYVPAGAFFLGSGANVTAAVAAAHIVTMGEFVRADRPNLVNEPFLVTAEKVAIPIRARQGLAQFEDIDGVIGVGTAASVPRPGGLSTASNIFTGNDPSAPERGLVHTAAPGVNSIGLLGEGENGIPSAFPKGFAAFYCMKYEITQGAYVDFLNTLIPEQQIARTRGITELTVANTRAMQQTNASDRNFIKVMRQGVIEFGVDMNNNNILNQEDDGENVACAMNFIDLMAYLDFAGLRPMTELEFEKACRGPRDPVPVEFAWGSTYWATDNTGTTAATAIARLQNPGRADERPVARLVNHIGSATEVAAQNSITRNGAFANDSSGRVVSGATYWGILEMSTNLRESVVSIVNASGRGFTGEHGDGRITTGGSPNVVGWPAAAEAHLGFGLRGGSTFVVPAIGSNHGVSNRSGIWWNQGVTVNTTGGAGNRWEHGGRGVRTAHTTLAGS